ncbi:MAG: hypothetical protein AAF748_05510 [Pseudomonadota bacterium]
MGYRPAPRMVAGICFPSLYGITESWLNAKATHANRAHLLWLHCVTQALGSPPRSQPQA